MLTIFLINFQKRKFIKKIFDNFISLVSQNDGVTSERIHESKFKITEQNLQCYENVFDVFKTDCLNPAEVSQIFLK